MHDKINTEMASPRNPTNSRRPSSTSPVQIKVSKCGGANTETRRKSCFAVPNYHHQRGNRNENNFQHHDRRISLPLPMDNLRYVWGYLYEGKRSRDENFRYLG